MKKNLNSRKKNKYLYITNYDCFEFWIESKTT